MQRPHDVARKGIQHVDSIENSSMCDIDSPRARGGMGGTGDIEGCIHEHVLRSALVCLFELILDLFCFYSDGYVIMAQGSKNDNSARSRRENPRRLMNPPRSRIFKPRMPTQKGNRIEKTS